MIEIALEDTKPYPSLPSTVLLIMAETEQELRLGANDSQIRVHNKLLELFPEWDCDQRWVFAYVLADAALGVS